MSCSMRIKKDNVMKHEGNVSQENPGSGKNPNSENQLNRSRKRGMIRGVLFTSLAGLALLAVAVILFTRKINEERARQQAALEAQDQEYTTLSNERDSVINEWVLTFDQIEKDLGAIVQKEKMISLESEGAELSTDKRQKILNDIKDINTLLEFNKKQIASLNAQLKKSGGSIQALEQKITDLENAIALREQEVGQLKQALVDKDFEIGELNTRMSGLETTLAQREEEISNQVKEMNRAYLACGTYEDLEEMGLVTKEGGFLGLLGKKEVLVEDFADSTFSQVDVTEITNIPVHSKDARLITEHPTGSYELVHENEKKIAYIEIKDPGEFWKISRYAVVEIIE